MSDYIPIKDCLLIGYLSLMDCLLIAYAHDMGDVHAMDDSWNPRTRDQLAITCNMCHTFRKHNMYIP